MAWKKAVKKMVLHLPLVNLFTHAEADWCLFEKEKKATVLRSEISYLEKKTDEWNSEIQDVEDKISEIKNTLSMPPNQVGENQPFEDLNKELKQCELSLKYCKDAKENAMIKAESAKQNFKQVNHEMKKITADLQMFKMNEAYWESAPQFVLQLSIQLREADMNWSDLKLDALSTIQLMSSLVSLLWTLSSLSVQLPVYLGGVVRAVRSNGFKDVLIVLVLNIFLLTPKLLTLSVAFGSVDETKWIQAFLLICSWLLAYMVCLAKATITTKVRDWSKKRYAPDPQNVLELQSLGNTLDGEESIQESLESKDMRIMGYVTAAFTPCVSHDVRAKHFHTTSVASTQGYIALAGSLLLMNLSEVLDSKMNDTFVSAIVCLVALSVTSVLSLIVRKILFRGNEYLEIMRVHARVVDFKEDIETETIFDLKSAFLAVRQKGQLSSEIIQAVGNTSPKILDQQNNKGLPALIEAANKGQVDVSRNLIQAGADPNIQDSLRGTALIWSAVNGQVDILSHLLQAGADPNIQAIHGSTALMWAARNGYFDFVSQLLNTGADPHLKSHNGRTALDWARDERIKTLLEEVNKIDG